MRTFFYFAPDRQAVTPADFAALGLAYAFERGVDCTQVERGPGGQRGVVFAQQDSYELGRNGYYPDKQTWRQIPSSPIWVGAYSAELPGPEDLARLQQLGGWHMKLADDQLWTVPLARSYSERQSAGDVELVWQIQLPQRLDLAADGRWTTGGVNPRYAALWELAEAWLRVRTGELTEADRARLDFQGQNDGAVLALQANFRLGRAEVALLGLLTDALVVEILDRLIDLPTLEAFTKKKAIAAQTAATPAAGLPSSAGPAAAIPITDPPSPI